MREKTNIHVTNQGLSHSKVAGIEGNENSVDTAEYR